jgi:hypothetical protein
MPKVSTYSYRGECYTESFRLIPSSDASFWSVGRVFLLTHLSVFDTQIM